MSAEIIELLVEVRRVFQCAAQATERIYRVDALTPASRSILEWLDRNGPATVSHIARSRAVSRQHIQTLVSDLADRGLLEASSNPAHRRSPFFDLSDEGARVIKQSLNREERYVASLPLRISPDEARAVTRTLAAIRQAMAHADQHR